MQVMKMLMLICLIGLLAPQNTFAADALRIRLLAPIAINSNRGPGFNTSLIDAATKKAGWVFQATDTSAITALGFRYGTRTGTPVQHRISIQGVSAATGDPDGTAVATAAFTPPADTTWNSLIQAITISHDGSGNTISSYTLTRGTLYAIVIEPCQNCTAPCSGAATPDSTNNSSFTATMTWSDGRPNFPYADTYNGSAWAKGTSAYPVYFYRSASRTYGFPIQAISTNATNSSGAEIGASFNLPSTWFTSFQVVGARAYLSPGAAGKTLKIVLYSGTTLLQSVTLDTDQFSAAGGNRAVDIYFADASLTTLSTGTTYRIGFSPQNTSQNLGLETLDLAAAGDRTAFAGQTTLALSTRTGCGSPCDATSTAWAADTTTSLPLVELILDVITAPSGGGQKAFGYAQ